MHSSTLRALGGSIAVTIPLPLARELGLGVGMRVNIKAKGDSLVLSAAGRRTYSLDDLLAMQGKTPLLADAQWDTMPALGKEIPL